MKVNTTSAWVIGIGLLFVVAIILLFMHWSNGPSISGSPEKPDDRPAATAPAATPKPVSKTVPEQATIDYDRLASDEKLRAQTDQRKSQYGLKNGVDMVVQAQDSIRVGGTTVQMSEILDKIALKKDQLVEKHLNDQNGTARREDDRVYGVYVVQPGDNIWNIHFQFLKDYFDSKGIVLSPLADEPVPNGSSSGIGKILKFSEKMVAIYNIETRRLETGLNRIQPLTKLVVYNMTDIFGLLDQINRDAVNTIRFDGETLWIPAEQ